MDLVNTAIAVKQHILREGLKTILADKPGVAVKGTAEYIGDLRELSLEEGDVVILDLDMPDVDALKLIQELQNMHPDVKILAISENEHPRDIKQIMQAGVLGYCLKTQPVVKLEKALRKIHSGEIYICNKAFQLLFDKNNYTEKESRFVNLTDRECQVLSLICEEMTNSEIAEKLHISVRTVDAHRQNILQKTGARNTAGLVKYAIRNNIYTL